MLNVELGAVVVLGLRDPYWADCNGTVVGAKQIVGVYGGDNGRVIAINNISGARDSSGADVLAATGLEGKTMLLNMRNISVVVSR